MRLRVDTLTMKPSMPSVTVTPLGGAPSGRSARSSIGSASWHAASG